MAIIKFEEVENKIITIRNQNAILDSDLAVLYEVETRDINKAVKNNPEKFPEGYVFELTKDEKNKLVKNFHHLNRLKYSSKKTILPIHVFNTKIWIEIINSIMRLRVYADTRNLNTI